MSFPKLAFLLLASLPLIGQTAFAEDVVKDGTPRYVNSELIPEFDHITPHTNFNFALTQSHAEGWHTYWKNPGDSGEATSIEWTLPEGFKAGKIIYPAPETQPTGPLMNFGFSGDVTLLTSIEVPETIKEDHVPITAKVSWLVCHDICVPEIKEFSFDLPVSNDPTTATQPEVFKAARASIPELKPWQGSLEENDQTLVLKFQLDGNSADQTASLMTAQNLFFFPEEWGIIKNAEPQEISVNDQTLTIKVQRDNRPLSEIESLTGVLTYSTTSGEKKSIQLTLPVSMKAANTGVPTPEPQPPVQQNPEEPTSFAQAVFLALLGGIILNLMPCVFPVLSMKALSLVKMSEREQKHANMHGLYYTLGILVCFAGIAGLLIGLQSAGEQIGWGFQLQNPVVILLLAYLLFAIALNLIGFLEIKGHLVANIGHKLTTRHGYSGTFFTGMLATIVATPCTAPFMATAMGYALTQPPVIALSVFMALGFGLALPYLALCMIPPLRKSLPKPGAWMETFRQFLSFPLFASVALLLWVYTQQVSGMYGTLLGSSGLLLIAFSIWIAKHEPRKQPLKTAVHALSIGSLILALVIAGLSHNPKNIDTTTATQTESNTIPYTKATLDELLAQNDPVLVDMTASWCITCQVNEKVAIETDATQELFRQKNVRYVVGDWTNQNAEITNYLKSYGRNGVPLYVFYGAKDPATGKRPEPRILPQLLTSGLIANVINGEE